MLLSFKHPHLQKKCDFFLGLKLLICCLSFTRVLKDGVLFNLKSLENSLYASFLAHFASLLKQIHYTQRITHFDHFHKVTFWQQLVLTHRVTFSQ